MTGDIGGRGDSDEQQRSDRLFGDDRARVPFAIIAVLLLVSAVALVGYLETRGSAETDTDASLAMDRTDASIQTTLRDATAGATQEAAAEPLTAIANTSWGGALDPGRPFVSYLEGLVYLEASERFAAAGQRVGDVETTVSLAPVTDPESLETAIDRVNITQTEPGLLSVELEEIQVTAARNNETLASRSETVDVSVPTPVLQQHERTQAFQEKLDAGITELGSFSQRFNARIYPLGWLRGYAQYGGAPVTEVIANRHVEPAVNSALYRTQQAVFGAADPNLDNAVSRGWFCMATQDAQSLYNGGGGGEVSVADDICEASEWVLGEKHSGALPDPPEALDLLGGAPGMNEEHTIAVNETAYSPLRALVAGTDEHSLGAAIERLFTIETAIDDEILVEGEPSFAHERPEPSADVTGQTRRHESVTVHGGTVTPGEPAANGTYYEFSDIDVDVGITEERTWEWTEDGTTRTATTVASGTLEVTVSVQLAENRTAPEANIEEFDGDIGVDHEYDHGPASPDDERTVPAPGFPNYADSQDGVAESVVGGTTLSAFEGWLGDQWENVTDADSITLPQIGEAVLELEPEQERELISTALEDISELQQTVERINHTFERTALVHGQDETGPVGGLVSAVEAERADYLDRESDYESVGQRAVYEIRHAYFETLLGDLRDIENAHGAVMGDLDSHLEEVDSSIGDAVSFLQQGVRGIDPTDDPEAPTLESPAITPNISYEVTGSPTYLAGEPVTSGEVPAVEEKEEFSPLAAKNTNYLKLPYETLVSGIVNTVLSLFGAGETDAELTLRTAGETLRAGELSEDAAAADGTYADDGELAGLNNELGGAVAEALDQFAVEMGNEVVQELYGLNPAATPPPETNETYTSAANATTEATAETVDGFDSTAGAALAVGGGTATDSLVTAISEALDDGEMARPPYAENLSTQEWQAVVAAGVRPALDRAAANATATLDSTALVENLDTATRQALENVSTDIVTDRLESVVGNGTFDLSEFEHWVGNGSEVDTPVRVPAGLPLLPLPTMWVATMNVWNIDADGRYARFEVEANVSAPGRATSTTYVRENRTVELEVDGGSHTLGAVEPIEFDGRSVLVVVVPPGGVGVGDRDDENPECTETYPVVGPFDEADTACKFLGTGGNTASNSTGDS